MHSFYAFALLIAGAFALPTTTTTTTTITTTSSTSTTSDYATPTTLPTLGLPTPSPSPSSAIALAARQDDTIGDCNVTGQYCCDSTLSHSSASASALTGLLGLPLSLLGPEGGASMGLACSPLASILQAGGQCSTEQVCCKGSQEMKSGLIGVNCSPLAL